MQEGYTQASLTTLHQGTNRLLNTLSSVFTTWQSCGSWSLRCGQVLRIHRECAITWSVIRESYLKGLQSPGLGSPWQLISVDICKSSRSSRGGIIIISCCRLSPLSPSDLRIDSIRFVTRTLDLSKFRGKRSLGLENRYWSWIIFKTGLRFHDFASGLGIRVPLGAESENQPLEERALELSPVSRSPYPPRQRIQHFVQGSIAGQRFALQHGCSGECSPCWQYQWHQFGFCGHCPRTTILPLVLHARCQDSDSQSLNQVLHFLLLVILQNSMSRQKWGVKQSKVRALFRCSD